MKSSKISITLLCAVVAVASGTAYWLGMQRLQPAQAVSATDSNARDVLYYRNPMGLPDTSPVPKKDSMGMDYVPVYAGDEAAAGQLRISLDKVQKLGVRTEPVASRVLAKTVRAVGRLQPDERGIVTVTTRFDGYIEKLLVSATGQPVKRGQPLMEVYSPELVSAQEEYLIARNGRATLRNGTAESVSGVDQLAEAALQRLRNWDISDAQLQRLQTEGTVNRTLTIYSPADGVVLEKTAQQGMRFMPGEMLYRIADLSTVWLIADVFEQDLSLVQPGQPVQISVDAYPEQEFSGEVAYIYPTVSPETRAAQVRVEMSNPQGLLKPDLYASLQLLATGEMALTVPDSAVIDSGTRQVVLVQRAEGLFEPREVTLGRRSDGHVEVLQGVSAGEQVVVRANFLIDAESNLQTALDGFSANTEHGGDRDGEHEDAAADEHEGH
jgi:Cu(I)/Ag(I) efflux system membrane fusion protein